VSSLVVDLKGSLWGKVVAEKVAENYIWN